MDTDIHTPFLQRLAQHYAPQCRDLYRHCFVFPNRRSGLFFRKYLSEAADATFLMPDVLTMGQLTARFSEGVEAHRIDQLFVLYTEYQRLTADAPEEQRMSFDRFAFWGDMILNDFNDADQYMADADRLFANVREYNEISTDPLTEEQRQALSLYFGDNLGAPSADFWKHVPGNDDNDAAREFRRLWALLADLYHGFRDSLAERGLSYQGRIYRSAVEAVKRAIEEDKLPYDRFVFVGFNNLSTSEIRIMELLRRAERASFHWDYCSALLHEEGNIGSRFISGNVSHFGAEEWEKEPCEPRAAIDIYSVPSQIGQAKLAGRLLRSLKADGAMPDDTRTAIVVPDAALLLPVRDAVPECIKDINVTMSIGLRTTAIAIIVSLLRQLHERARMSQGKWLYFHQDVKNLLTDPVVHRIAPKAIDALLAAINRERLYMVEAAAIAGLHPHLARLVAPLKRDDDTADGLNDPQLIISYLRGVLAIVEEQLGEADGDVEMAALDQYHASVDRLEALISRSRLQRLSDHTFFYLIDRLVASMAINFDGQPLHGLQILSPAEARLLDFDNVIFLSFNEHIYPRRQRAGSFIPNLLRQSYGLPTTADADAAMTYDFYRLLTRARRVALIYDNRTTGLNTGEPSRFAQQLLNVYADRLTIATHAVNYRLDPASEPDLVVPKTPKIMEEINRFRTPATGPDDRNARYLSASSIYTFLQCPMKFYLGKIAGLDREQDTDPFVEASTFGTIVHDSLSEMYRDQLHGDITADNIRAKLTPEVRRKIVARNVNRIFLNRTDGSDATLSGVSFLVETVVRQYVDTVLDYDARFGPFRLVSTEKQERQFWQLTRELGFNFVQYIDRLDRDREGKLHIVDYKTGSDLAEAASIEELFTACRNKNQKGIFQLIIYSLFHNYLTECDEPVRPELYRIKKMAGQERGKPMEVVIEKEPVEDCRDYAAAFVQQLSQSLAKLFSPDEPFTCCPPGGAHSPCTFCPFTDLCGR